MYRVQLSRGSKFAYVIKKAIASVRKYPLPITSGRQAMDLKGVGPAIANKIDQVCQPNANGPLSKENEQHNVTNNSTTTTTTLTASTSRTKPTYVPGFQTSTWFVLVSFHVHRTHKSHPIGSKCPELSVTEVQTTAQQLCQQMKGSNAPAIGQSALNSLVKRGILKVRAAEHKQYRLTKEGRVVVDYAVQLPKASLAIANARVCLTSSSSSSSSSSDLAMLTSVGFSLKEIEKTNSSQTSAQELKAKIHSMTTKQEKRLRQR
jgi:DNA-binding PadR family transcriptional regulator